MSSLFLGDYNWFYYTLFKDVEVHKWSTLLGVNIVSDTHQFWSWTLMFMMKRELSGIGIFPRTSESRTQINQIYCIIWCEAVTLLVHINKKWKRWICNFYVKLNSLPIQNSESFHPPIFIQKVYYQSRRVKLCGGSDDHYISRVFICIPHLPCNQMGLDLVLIDGLRREVILSLLGWGNNIPMLRFMSSLSLHGDPKDCLPAQYFSNFNVHTNHLGILLKYRF